MNKFNNLYNIIINQINEEISTFLVKDNKLSHNNTDNSTSTNQDIQEECNTAGLTTGEVIGPGTPETSISNTITTNIPIKTPIKNSCDSGITTNDIKQIYTPGKVNYKRKRKNKN